MVLTPNEFRNVRKYLGLTTRQMASVLKVSQTYVCYLEKGERVMPAYVAERLEVNREALDVIDEFIEKRKRILVLLKSEVSR